MKGTVFGSDVWDAAMSKGCC